MLSIIVDGIPNYGISQLFLALYKMMTRNELTFCTVEVLLILHIGFTSIIALLVYCYHIHMSAFLKSTFMWSWLIGYSKRVVDSGALTLESS